jgi:plasmid stability protein
MKSITIHNMDEKLYKKIKNKAYKKGLSLNKTIKRLLEEALGIKNEIDINNRDEFIEFLGAWSKEEMKEFELNIKDLESIDKSDWQ